MHLHHRGPASRWLGQLVKVLLPEVLRLPAELARVAQLLEDPGFIDRGADTLGGTGTCSSCPPEVLTATTAPIARTRTTTAVRTSSMMAMIRAALACSRPDRRPPEGR